MIKFEHQGSFNNTTKMLNRIKNLNIRNILAKYGSEGVSALSAATPVDSGATASSWSYTITANKNGYVVKWTNSNVVGGIPVAILLQYGHGTGTGGYVQGRDFINPAIQPIFDRIAEEAWREVTKI